MTTAPAYKLATEQQPTTTRIVRIAFRCGCTKVIGHWTTEPTASCCEKHGDGPKVVETIERTVY